MAEYNNRLNDLVLIPSLKCDLECDHCCRCSGPDRTERMTPAVLSAIRSEIPDWISGVTISGGEPFLDLDLLLEVASILPETTSLYIATNGLWTRDPAKRYKFFSEVLPSLKQSLESHADLGLTIELSLDQFHRWQDDARDGWRCLKDEAKNGCEDPEDPPELEPEPDPDDFDDEDLYWEAMDAWEQESWEIRDQYYCYPDMESVTICERSEHMHKVLPIGRGVGWASWDDSDREYCNFDGNDRIENQLTIWPDGRCSACCDGGAWVGNILTQDLPTILKQRRSFLFWLRRQAGTYLNGGSGVPTATCEKCRKLGRKFFGTSFKATQ